MEVSTIIYKAKDGKLFYDPLECEQYEKTIGILPGSIADMVQFVKDNMGDCKYMTGAVFYAHPDGKKTFHNLDNMCIDDKLESFVNVKDLQEEQRYVFMTVDNFISYYDKEELKDCPCQWLLAMSEHIDMREICTMSNGNNPNMWNKKEDK